MKLISKLISITRNRRERVKSCPFCGENAYYTPPYGKVLCEACFYKRYDGCDGCGDIVPIDSIIHINKLYLCKKCYKIDLLLDNLAKVL